MEIISLHLAGSTKCEGQDFIRSKKDNGYSLQPENLIMVRELNNPVDTNAVQVWYDDNGEKVRLGYIQRDQAPEVAECMDEGGMVFPIELTICGSSDTNYGLYFEAQVFYPSDVEPPDYDLDIPDDCDWDFYGYDSYKRSVDNHVYSIGIARLGVPL